MRFCIAALCVCFLCSCAAPDGEIGSFYEQVQNSARGHDWPAFCNLIYEGEDAVHALDSYGPLETFWADADIRIGVSDLHDARSYSPPMEVPGSLDGVQLRYVPDVVQWLVVTFSQEEGTGKTWHSTVYLPVGISGGKSYVSAIVSSDRER